MWRILLRAQCADVLSYPAHTLRNQSRERREWNGAQRFDGWLCKVGSHVAIVAGLS